MWNWGISNVSVKLEDGLDQSLLDKVDVYQICCLGIWCNYIALSHTNDACHTLVRALVLSRVKAGLLQWASCQSTGLSSSSTVQCDACCCQTHPPTACIPPISSIAGRSHLPSAASGDLCIPATNAVTIGPRAFAVACPAWNSLPPELHDKSLSLMTFRKKLKTYLFKTS